MNYLKQNLKAFWLFTDLKFKKVLTFKTNLILQTLGMFINNLALFSVWYLLLYRFGSINGYGMLELILITGFVAVFYAFFFWFFGGVAKLGEYLNQDRFLDLQLYPVSPLTILLTKGGNASQLGDFVQGFVFLAIYAAYNPASIPILIIGVFLVTFGLLGVMLFFNSIIFFNPKIVDVFTQLIQNIYLGASQYPSQNFQGLFKFILYAILLIPIVAFPIEAARGFMSPTVLLWTVLTVIGINIAGYMLWQAGVRKVESGSSGGVVE